MAILFHPGVLYFKNWIWGGKKKSRAFNCLNVSMMMIRVFLKQTNIRKFKDWYETIISPYLVAPTHNNSIENSWNQWVIWPEGFIYNFLFLWQEFHDFKARLKNTLFPPLSKWSGCCMNKAKGWAHMARPGALLEASWFGMDCKCY